MQRFKSCMECTKRYPGCHAKCEEYLKARAELDEINEIKNANRSYWAYTNHKITKRKKEKMRKRPGGRR